MVVRNSVTFSVTRIGSQVDRSKALNYIRTGEHLLVSSRKMARHMSSVRHNWSLLKSDRFPLPNVTARIGVRDHPNPRTMHGRPVAPNAQSARIGS